MEIEDLISELCEDTYVISKSDLENYWIEHYGAESWVCADFDDIDSEIQNAMPNLYFVDVNGDNYEYTTDINNAR